MVDSLFGNNIRLTAFFLKNSFLSKFVIFAFSFLLFLPTAFIDPDPHHDGYMLADSIAFKNGLWPNSNIFAQYGPLTPVIQGALFHFLPTTLLTLRIFTALQLALIALFIFLISEILYTSRIGLFASSIFCLTSPDWTFHNTDLISQWPWPSVLTNLLIISAIYLFLRGRKNNKVFYHYFAGVLLALAAISRNATGVALAILLLVLVIIQVKYFRDFSLIKALNAFILVLIAFFGFLVVSGGLKYFLNDTLIGPLSTGNTSGVKFWTSLKNISLGGLLFTPIILFSLRNWCKLHRKGGFGIFLVIGLLATSISFSSRSSQHQYLIRFFWFLPNSLYLSVVNIFQHISIFIPLIWIAKNFKKVKGFKSFSKRDQDIFTTTLLGLSSICDLYPLGDLGHLWWGSSIILLVSVGYLTEMALVGNSLKILNGFIIGVLIVALGLYGLQLSIKRERLNDESVFNGMYVKPRYLPVFNDANAFMFKIKGKKLHIDCNDGAFSIWNRQYISASPNFVSWGWSLANNDYKSKLFLFCAQSRDQVLEYAAQNGLTVVSSEFDNDLSKNSGIFSSHNFNRLNYLVLLERK